MRIRLLKKWDWVHKTFSIGTVLEVSDGLAKKMITDGLAEHFSDSYPPKEKMKTDLFKPKNRKINGKG